MAVTCIECGAQLRVVVYGGEFLVRKGSTLDLLNFEKVKKVDFETATEIDDDTMLQVEVECSVDPAHMIFGTAASAIYKNIYERIERGAKRLRKEIG